jgi:HD-GYP domain-containing protein (c-di-GMP phosphodiesterase class II)
MTSATQVRLSELIAALSLATDLGMGQPMEQALNTCLLSVKAGRSLGLEGSQLSEVYYLALLRFIGCTADAHEEAASVGGDEIALRSGLAVVIMGETPEFMRYMLRNYAAGTPSLTRLRLLAAAMADGTKGARRTIAEHCEVAKMLVARMGINPAVGEDVGCVFERWDGKGLPGELAGDAIPLPARIVAVARDVDIFTRIGGPALVAEVLKKRRGKAYDPSVADGFLAEGEAWLKEAGQQPAWDAVIEAEPEPQFLVGESNIDGVLSTFADFADLKSPFTAGHSTHVGDLAAAAGRVAGLDRHDVDEMRRAGYVHDLGKTGIPNGIWDREGPLSQPEWERVRLHPYLTERILAYSPSLKSIAAIAGSHHERMDASGYHRGTTGTALAQTARLLAAADVYQAMGEPRPFRPALDARARERELLREAADGKLDREAVRAVLEAAGHVLAAPRRYTWPAGLTEREVEVLRLIIRGHSNRSVADELTISTKTVGRHIENIYGKIGVSSRATAALFAMEHGLLSN